MPRGIPSFTLRKLSNVDDAATEQRLPGPRPKHGLTTLKRAVNTIGNRLRLIDRRTVTGRALAKWRADLIQDMGGDVSTQQSAIIDLAVKSKLMLDSIDAWQLTQPSLINHRKRTLLPVVKERQALADGLAKYLAMLGLKRVSKQISLHDILSQQADDHDDKPGNGNGADSDER